MRRRLRRRDNEPEGAFRPNRLPAGVYWTILAVLVLLLVLGYDRREQRDARDHVTAGQELRNQKKYEDAVAEYERALANPRLSRKAKADVALTIGDIYFDHLNNRELASSFYIRARHLYPKLTERPDVRDRMQAAQKSARTLSMERSVAEETTPTASFGNLISPPAQDLRGPVIATVKGHEIHAGEIARALRNTGTRARTMYENDPKQLQAMIADYVNKSVAYYAAIDRDLFAEPAIHARMYDAQRIMLEQAYEKMDVEKAQTVLNRDVEQYYQQHQSEFATQTAVGVAMIVTDDRASAEQARAALISGTKFPDVVTSYSKDAASKANSGITGKVSDTDDSVPGLGKAPDVVKKLCTMNMGEVSGITEVNGKYCIFRILNKQPGRHMTLDDARAQIEEKLRKLDSAALPKQLREKMMTEYQPKIEKDAVAALAAFDGATTSATLTQSRQTSEALTK